MKPLRRCGLNDGYDRREECHAARGLMVLKSKLGSAWKVLGAGPQTAPLPSVALIGWVWKPPRVIVRTLQHTLGGVA